MLSNDIGLLHNFIEWYDLVLSAEILAASRVVRWRLAGFSMVFEGGLPPFGEVLHDIFMKIIAKVSEKPACIALVSNKIFAFWILDV